MTHGDTTPTAIPAVAIGTNDVRDGLPVLTDIELQYKLRIPAGSRDKVDRALARHQQKCPTAETLKGAVQVSWTASIEEVDDVA